MRDFSIQYHSIGTSVKGRNVIRDNNNNNNNNTTNYLFGDGSFANRDIRMRIIHSIGPSTAF